MTDIPPTQPQASAAAPDHKGDCKAMASFVLGLCSIIPTFGLLIGLLAIIFGIVALVQKTTKTRLAVAGLVLGVVLSISGSVGFAVGLQYSRKASLEAACATNMSALGKGIIIYSAEHDSYPTDLEVLLVNGYGTENGFRCYLSGHDKGVRDYLYVCPSNELNLSTNPTTNQTINQNLPHSMIMACDIGKWHHHGGRSVLYVDGTAKLCRTDAEFQAELAKPENARFAAALRQAEAALNSGR